MAVMGASCWAEHLGLRNLKCCSHSDLQPNERHVRVIQCWHILIELSLYPMLPAQCIAFDLQAAKMLKSSREFVVGTAAFCNLHGANG